MSKFSLTQGGILAMIALPLLVQAGFSEQCAGEIWTIVPMIPGAVAAWYGRFRKGDITLGGFRKDR